MFFSTFICAECAQIHFDTYSATQSYIKELFSESWDTFQLRAVQVGGNKRFYDFMKEYNKEREPIEKKYDTSAAAYYRKMIAAQAQGKEWTDIPPARNATEFAERSANATVKFWEESNEKYKIAENVDNVAQKTKAGIMSLWAKATGKPEGQ